jgi:hypothetical protein
VRCVDVWTSLSAKVCVFQNVSPELRKGEKMGENLVNVGFSHVTCRKNYVDMSFIYSN